MDIKNKDTINKTLDNNLLFLSKKLNELTNDSCFTHEQSYTLNEICREIFYCLDDLTESIKYLNK